MCNFIFLLGIDISKLIHVVAYIDFSTNKEFFLNLNSKMIFKDFSALLDKIKSFDVEILLLA